MTTLTLGDLRSLPGVQAIVGDESVRITGLASDSRRITQGNAFAVISGGAADGASFVPQANANGAVALLSDRPLDLGLPVVLVDNVRKRLGPIAHRVYGDPTQTLRTVAITGTNGKTTVTHLIEQVLEACGQKPALLGTIALRGPAYQMNAELTTPEADVIARFAHEQLAAGASHLLMEASSHALDQDRLLGCQVEIAGFTNLTQDHLDYHGTMESYGAAKTRLFTDYAPELSVIMVDQPFGRDLSVEAKGKIWRASMRSDTEAELRVVDYQSTRAGVHARVQTPVGELVVNSPLFGAHNLENLLITLGVTLQLGLEPARIVAALQAAVGAPGRMERVANSRDVMVLVDYAHTPDALERALLAVKPLTQGRLFVVCGCGGDRDRSKRAPMAEAAVRLADLTVLTSDNPRTEEPLAILADMEIGARLSGSRLPGDKLTPEARGYVVIPDRAQAIAHAIAAARAGDTVLLAGKGHETYQIVGRDKRPFDDRREAAQALAVGDV